MMEMVIPVATGVVIVFGVLFCVALLFKAFYYKIDQTQEESVFRI